MLCLTSPARSGLPQSIADPSGMLRTHQGPHHALGEGLALFLTDHPQVPYERHPVALLDGLIESIQKSRIPIRGVVLQIAAVDSQQCLLKAGP